MIRPNFEEIIKPLSTVGFITCPQCKCNLQTKEQAKKHWKDSHFDYPETLGISTSDGIGISEKIG